MAQNAGLSNTELPIKCNVGHVTPPNLLTEVKSWISGHWPSPKSFCWVELKTALYEGQTGEQIFGNLVCIVLIIGSELDVTKYSLTTHESKYIELIFHEKSRS